MEIGAFWGLKCPTSCLMRLLPDFKFHFRLHFLPQMSSTGDIWVTYQISWGSELPEVQNSPTSCLIRSLPVLWHHFQFHHLNPRVAFWVCARFHPCQTISLPSIANFVSQKGGSPYSRSHDVTSVLMTSHLKTQLSGSDVNLGPCQIWWWSDQRFER